MSDTPKTDAMMTALLWRTGETLIADVEFADFARELERENAALRSLIDDPNAMHSHYLRECNGWEVWQAERIRRFQDASEQLEQLQRENAALREENAEWREMIREAVFDNNDILYWIRGARSILLDAVEKDRAAYAARKEAKP